MVADAAAKTAVAGQTVSTKPPAFQRHLRLPGIGPRFLNGARADTRIFTPLAAFWRLWRFEDALRRTEAFPSYRVAETERARKTL